jgi:hypothetical protein
MPKTSNQMIEKINGILEKYNQLVRVVFWSSTEIKLSNGTVYTNGDRKKFILRITNKKTDLWVKNIDKLLDGSISESEIKSLLASVGGKSCQKLHGEKIKKNLNTGVPWIKGKTGVFVPWNKGLSKHSDERIKSMSRDRIGAGNPFFGRKHTDTVKEDQSNLMKNKILKGEFTPNSNNRNTHWDAFFDNKKYRSSWEALYQYLNPDAEYEKLRIPYYDEGKEKIYIVDFIDYRNKLVVEVKPKELCSGRKFESKMRSLNLWAEKNNFRLLIVSKDWFLSNKAQIDYNRFDEKTQLKLKKLYETS